MKVIESINGQLLNTDGHVESHDPGCRSTIEQSLEIGGGDVESHDAGCIPLGSINGQPVPLRGAVSVGAGWSQRE